MNNFLSSIISNLVVTINLVLYYVFYVFFYISFLSKNLISKSSYFAVLLLPIVMFEFIFTWTLTIFWFLFDFIILFLRDALFPLFSKIFNYVRIFFNFLIKRYENFFLQFKLMCNPMRKYCSIFDEKKSYFIANINEIKDFMKINEEYENEIKMIFQNKLFLLKKESEYLDQAYLKVKKFKNKQDIIEYNGLLSDLQSQELNIVANYNISISQHRVFVTRMNSARAFVKKPQKLSLVFNGMTYVNAKMVIA